MYIMLYYIFIIFGFSIFTSFHYYIYILFIKNGQFKFPFAIVAKSSTPLIPICKLTITLIHDSILNRELFAALHWAARSRKVFHGVILVKFNRSRGHFGGNGYSPRAGDQISAAAFKLLCKLWRPPVISWTWRPPISRPKLLLCLVTSWGCIGLLKDHFWSPFAERQSFWKALRRNEAIVVEIQGNKRKKKLCVFELIFNG